MSRFLLGTNICVHTLKNEFGIKQKFAEVGTGHVFFLKSILPKCYAKLKIVRLSAGNAIDRILNSFL